MWIFRHIVGRPGRYNVGFYEMYWETETMQAQRFVNPYGDDFDLEQAETKVHYLNGGSAGALGSISESISYLHPKI